MEAKANTPTRLARQILEFVIANRIVSPLATKTTAGSRGTPAAQTKQVEAKVHTQTRLAKHPQPLVAMRVLLANPVTPSKFVNAKSHAPPVATKTTAGSRSTPNAQTKRVEAKVHTRTRLAKWT
jgi:hypothetical protein